MTCLNCGRETWKDCRGCEYCEDEYLCQQPDLKPKIIHSTKDVKFHTKELLENDE